MAKPIKHVMVDCETLALGPQAAIIDLAFTYLHNGRVTAATECISPSRYFGVSGFEVDDNTLQWHKKTAPENLARCCKAETTIVQMAEFVREVIDTAKEDGTYAIWLWACGTDFDIPKLTNLLAQCHMKPNWGYTYVRDYRTLRELYKDIVPMDEKGDHTALKDCVVQYKHLMRILEHMDSRSVCLALI